MTHRQNLNSFWYSLEELKGFPDDSSKENACQCRRCKRSGFDPWVRRSPGGGHGNPLSILAWRIPWKWGRKESDTIEQLSTAQHTYQWRRQELKSVQQTLFLTFWCLYIIFIFLFLNVYMYFILCFYSRSFLVICFRYSSMYMSVPNSQSVPLRDRPPSNNHKFILLSLWVCSCFADKFICIIFLGSTFKWWSYDICLPLSDWLRLVW